MSQPPLEAVGKSPMSIVI